MADNVIETSKVIDVLNTAIKECTRRQLALEGDVQALTGNVEELTSKLAQLVALVDSHEIRVEVIELVVKPQKGRAN
jgi:phage-related minor tail protein